MGGGWLVKSAVLAGLAVGIVGCSAAAGQGVTIPPGTATFEALTSTIVPGGTALPAYAPAQPAPTPFGTPYTPPTPEPSFLPALGLRELGAPGPARWPSTDGVTVIWQEPEERLWAVRLADGHAYPPLALPPDAGPFSVAGDLVAGRVADTSPDCPPNCRGHILVQNFVTGATVPFTDTHRDAVAAALDGDWLVWQALDPLPGPSRTRTPPGPPQENLAATNYLLARNLKTGGPPVLLRQTTDAMSMAVVDGERTLWAEQTDTEPPQTTLYLGSLAGGPPTIVAQGAEISRYSYDLRGDLLLYQTTTPDALWAVDLRNGRRQSFAHGAHATTDGRYIFWIDHTEAVGHVFRLDLHGYDTAGNNAFMPVMNARVNDFPQARGGYLIWQHAASPYDPALVYALDLAEAGWPR